MEKKFGELWDLVLNLLLGNVQEQKILLEKTENLQKAINFFKNQDILEEFLLFGEKVCCDNSEAYASILLFIAQITEEPVIRVRWLESLLQLEAEKRDFWGYLKIKNQYDAAYFRSGLKLGQEKEWEQSDYLLGEVQKLLHMDCEWTLPEERNQDLVIIAVTQLLGERHAPTRIALELCRIIETYLHKKVFLLCGLVLVDFHSLLEIGMKPEWIFVPNYIDELTGEFIYPYKERGYQGYQILLKEDNAWEMQQLMQNLYQYKPYCVWCIGGMPVFAGAMRQFTTVIYTKCSNGYPGIAANMVVNYFEQTEKLCPYEKTFLLDKGVAVKDINIGMPSYKKSEGKWTRNDIKIPPDAFGIAIMGNRLEEDCTDDFLEMLNIVSKIRSEKELYFIFIGQVETYFEKKVAAYMEHEKQVCFLGYQEEFAEAVALADILIATPGLGNGGAGTAALLEGKPVISLKVGDVGSVAGEDFQCGDLGDYPALVKRYIEDQEFYISQSRKAKKRIEGLLVSDEELAAQIEDIMSEVRRS